MDVDAPSLDALALSLDDEATSLDVHATSLDAQTTSLDAEATSLDVAWNVLDVGTNIRSYLYQKLCPFIRKNYFYPPKFEFETRFGACRNFKPVKRGQILIITPFGNILKY
ncbi:hypothetical protein [Sporosarcina thermotolerans]|uniref:hypothetical protein n=1 Tax=Sporosarcina thermotolerans TaxID=633404 RepID=UPI0036D3370B